MKKYSFEKLNVWQLSREMVKEIYIETKVFPEKEKYGLTSQIRRVMVSVSCNIAEGTSRWSSKEKIRYIEIAFSSLMETLNCLILAVDIEYMTEWKLKELRIKISEIANKLNGLKKSYEK